MTVSEAERLNAIKSIVGRYRRTAGDPPSKRKRSIYRAIDRKEPEVVTMFMCEVGTRRLMNDFAAELYAVTPDAL